MDDLKGKGTGKLAMDFARGKGKGQSKDDLRRAQAFHTFASNDAPNFPCWYQVWQVNFCFSILFWSGYQKEHLDLSLLLNLSMASPEDLLPMRVVSTYFPGMFRGRIPSGLYFAYDASPYCRSTFHHFGRTFCRRLNFDQPTDIVPFTFTMWICFPATTWHVLASRFQNSGALSAFSGDVPWTCDSEGHPGISFSFSPRSSIYLLSFEAYMVSCKSWYQFYFRHFELYLHSMDFNPQPTFIFEI